MVPEYPKDSPLILTVAVDEAAQERFETLRRAHFPAQINRIPAHLTLFHKLPAEERPQIVARLAAAAGACAPMPFRTSGVIRLGRGAAFAVSCDGLKPLHAELQRDWREWLTPQDGAPLRPHVTVQNKVDNETAEATADRLRGLPAIEGFVTGLILWRYLGGPWALDAEFPFAPQRAGGIE